jgi:hypothetical protein
LLSSKDEDIVTRFIGVPEERGFPALAGREQRETAAVLGFRLTGPSAVFLPLIYILTSGVELQWGAHRRTAVQPVGIGRDEGV